MALQPLCPGLETQQVGAVTVARLTRNDVLDEHVIKTIGGRLSSLVQGGGCRQLVVNLGAVKRVASSMVGNLIWLHKQVHGAGGRMAVCGLDPKLAAAFRTLQLDRLFDLHSDEAEALRACGEEAATPDKTTVNIPGPAGHAS